MKKTFPLSLGLTAGSFAGIVHIVWSILVAAGWAQPLMNWVAKLHFVTPPFHLQPFDLGNAITVVIVTSVLGFIAGYVFGYIWTIVRKS